MPADSTPRMLVRLSVWKRGASLYPSRNCAPSTAKATFCPRSPGFRFGAPMTTVWGSPWP